MASGRETIKLAKNAGLYSGTLQLKESKAVLTTDQAEIELLVDSFRDGGSDLVAARTKTVAQLKPFAGQPVTVRGVKLGEAEQIWEATVRRSAIPATNRDDANRSKFDAVQSVLEKQKQTLLALPDVLSVRAGYKLNGWITGEPAIVVTILPKPGQAPGAGLPRVLDGVPVDIALATPLEQLEVRHGAALSAAAENLGTFGHLGEEPTVPDWQFDTPDGLAGMVSTFAARSHLIPYQPPPDASLDEINDAAELVLHTSPDAGWPTLKGFLESVKKTLTIGMYDFTAPHIVETLDTVMKRTSGALELCLDPGESLADPGGDGAKANDEHEDKVRGQLQSDLGDRLQFEWAAVTHQGKVRQGIFPSAYHIKVAVADSRDIWLSSGNWQSSNQPDTVDNHIPEQELQRKYNREWHIVARGSSIAPVYEKFLKWDFLQAGPLQEAAERLAPLPLPALLVPEEAIAMLAAAAPPKFFKPKTINGRTIRIQPLLTPDNYFERALPVLEGAEQSIRFQNQYIKISKQNTEQFLKLVDALRDKQKSGLDVRIIVRDLPGVAAQLEALQAHGFDVKGCVRVQNNVHNKGIIVDDKIAVIGSHNWSNEGVLRNRDASLILYDEEVAAFYAQIFDYDWNSLARQRTAFRQAMPILLMPGQSIPPGYRTVRWTDLHED